MSSGYALNTIFKIKTNELSPFLNLQILLDSGEEIPLYHNGMRVGSGISCVISEKDYYENEYQTHPTSTSTQIDMKFVLDRQLNAKIINIYPIMILFEQLGQHKTQFRLIKNFVVETK